MIKKILYVDDDEDILFAVKKILENVKNEYIVIGVKSGDECLKWMSEGEKPDLILLDIMMSEMSGWEVFDAIKDNPDWNHIPIAFLTARTDEIAENAGGLLADDYIEKPIDPNDFIQRIEKLITHK